MNPIASFATPRAIAVIANSVPGSTMYASPRSSGMLSTFACAAVPPIAESARIRESACEPASARAANPRRSVSVAPLPSVRIPGAFGAAVMSAVGP
jgi:hypothetical protein